VWVKTRKFSSIVALERYCLAQYRKEHAIPDVFNYQFVSKKLADQLLTHQHHECITAAIAAICNKNEHLNFLGTFYSHSH
jgi:hypothetical protein